MQPPCLVEDNLRAHTYRYVIVLLPFGRISFVSSTKILLIGFRRCVLYILLTTTFLRHFFVDSTSSEFEGGGDVGSR